MAQAGVKQKYYRIYTEDIDDYHWGGPLFGPFYQRTIRATSPREAKLKFLVYSRKKRLGWKFGHLTYRTAKQPKEKV